MPDIFDQLSQPKGDIFDQLSRTPADASPEMQAAQRTAAQNPVLTGLQNTGKEIGATVGNVLGPAVRGIQKNIGMPGDGQNIQGPDLSKAPMVEKVANDIIGGGTYGLAATAAGGGNPVLGYGVMGALSAAGNNQSPSIGAIQGATTGAVQGLAGLAGSNALQGLVKPLANVSEDAARWLVKYAPNIGTSLGMGGVNAVMAPAGQKTEAGATGAAFGAMSPMAGPRFITSDEYQNKYLPDAGDKMLGILNVGKNVYKNFDKNGVDIDDAAQTLAHNRVVIGKTADGNIDTSQGQQQMLDATKPYAQQLKQMLATNQSTLPEKGGFDLEDIRNQALAAIPKNPNFEDAVSRQNARDQVNKFIDAEIDEPGRGRYINGQTLDDIKGGWWKVRYDQNNLSAKPAGYLLGNIAKTTLENGYPDQPIQQTNAAQAKLLNAYHLLDMTNNNKIKGGKLGNMVSTGIGGMIGVGAGHLVPIPGVGETIGGGLGAMIGHESSKYVNDPTRISTDIGKGLDNLRIVNPSQYNESSSTRKGTVTPEVLQPSPRNIPTPQELGISMNPVLSLPSPRSVAYNPSGVQNSYRQGAMVPPNVMSGPTLPAGRPDLPYQPGPQAITTNPMNNPYLKYQQPHLPQQGNSGSMLGGSMNPISKVNPTAKALGAAALVGLGSALNPVNAQAHQALPYNKENIIKTIAGEAGNNASLETMKKMAQLIQYKGSLREFYGGENAKNLSTFSKSAMRRAEQAHNYALQNGSDGSITHAWSSSDLNGNKTKNIIKQEMLEEKANQDGVHFYGPAD